MRTARWVRRDARRAATTSLCTNSGSPPRRSPCSRRRQTPPLPRVAGRSCRRRRSPSRRARRPRPLRAHPLPRPPSDSPRAARRRSRRSSRGRLVPARNPAKPSRLHAPSARPRSVRPSSVRPSSVRPSSAHPSTWARPARSASCSRDRPRRTCCGRSRNRSRQGSKSFEAQAKPRSRAPPKRRSRGDTRLLARYRALLLWPGPRGGSRRRN